MLSSFLATVVKPLRRCAAPGWTASHEAGCAAQGWTAAAFRNEAAVSGNQLENNFEAFLLPKSWSDAPSLATSCSKRPVSIANSRARQETSETHGRDLHRLKAHARNNKIERTGSSKVSS